MEANHSQVLNYEKGLYSFSSRLTIHVHSVTKHLVHLHSILFLMYESIARLFVLRLFAMEEQKEKNVVIHLSLRNVLEIDRQDVQLEDVPLEQLQHHS